MRKSVTAGLAALSLSALSLLPVVGAAASETARSTDAVVAATQRYCIDPLARDTALGFGLERAPAAMEAKLLNGKLARIFRTDDPQILVVAHDSGKTCDIMALGKDVGAFGAAIGDWQLDTAPFIASPDSQIHLDKPGGGFYAAQRAEGGFVQMFVTTQPQYRSIVVNVVRAQDSALAREVLGLE